MLVVVSFGAANATGSNTAPPPPATSIEVMDCDLTVGESIVVIYEACRITNLPFFTSVVRFLFGVNSIECIENGFRVTLQEADPDHGFVIIDIIDDL